MGFFDRLGDDKSGGLLGLIKNPQTRDMLLALGAGIAGGATKGWGAGIGAGLAGAGQAKQDFRQNDLREKAYALQQATLENQINYQNASLENTKANTAINQGLRDDANATRAQAEARQEAELSSPVGMISSAAPGYAAAKKELLSPQAWGSWTRGTGTGGGVIGRALDPMKTALMGAAAIQKLKPEALFERFLPTGPEDAQDKINQFEQYMAGLHVSLGKGYPALAPSLADFDKFNVTPPSDPATTTAVQQGGAPVGGAAEASMAPRVGGEQSGQGMIPPEAVRLLKSNPAMRAAFEAKYKVSAEPFLR